MTTLAAVRTHAAAPHCPSWCEEGAGHDYELMDVDGTAAREHCTVVSRGPSPDDRVFIAAYAKAWAGVSGEKVDDPRIDIVIEGMGEDTYIDNLTADRARELAHFLHGALLTAANRLDRITEEQPA